MATELRPFLTSIANAIRTKKGTTEPINAQNFASEIESIESGGGTGGLVGYSGTTTIFKVGLKEDGTLTKTYSATDKYVCFVVEVPTNFWLDEKTNVEYERVGSYAFVRPTADNWKITLGGGGSND